MYFSDRRKQAKYKEARSSNNMKLVRINKGNRNGVDILLQRRETKRRIITIREKLLQIANELNITS